MTGNQLLAFSFIVGLWFGAVGGCAVHGASTGLQVSATLDDGATDGDEGYFKFGEHVVLMVHPQSPDYPGIAALKGKVVTLTVVAE